jgi:spermidine synthase
MARDRFAFFVILLLFTASGAAALIYEVTWYQLLQLVVGSTAISLGLLLASFMGGLCLGSYFLPRRVPKTLHPLRLFALIELGIAGFGLLVLWLLPALSTLYIAAVQVGLSSMLLRGVLAAICLLPPTVLMGASLPVISRMAGFSRRAEALWGWLYAGNTLGAAGGAVLASFVLLRLFDVGIATYAAAAINVAVALIALMLALWLKQSAEPYAAASARSANDRGALWPVTLAIGLSGATALGAEVVFTRLLGMLFASTVYAFATILTVFCWGSRWEACWRRWQCAFCGPAPRWACASCCWPRRSSMPPTSLRR